MNDGCLVMLAAHLRTYLKECGSFARKLFQGKRIHLRTQFALVNVTFAFIRFSQVHVNSMFTLARLFRQVKSSFPVQAIHLS